MKRIAAGIATTAVVVAGAGLLSAAPALAANVGTMSFAPAVGSAQTAPTFNTSGKCSIAGELVKVTMIGGATGFNLATPKNVVGNQAENLVPTNATNTGYSIPAPLIWHDFALNNGLAGLSGSYTVSAVCATSGDHFDGVLVFGGTPNLTAANTYAAVRPTTTVLSPATQTLGYGSPATVTATVSSDAVPTGTVQFSVDGTASGSPVAINASGVATFTVPTSTPSGTHSVTAVFTPDTAGTTNGFQSSTAATAASVTFTKSNPTVVLSDSTTGTAPAGTATTLSATITPGSLAGNVTFSDGGTVLGTTAVNTTTGVASFVWNISPGATVGAHALSAQFTPTDTVNVNTPAAATESFTVTAALGINVSGNITLVLPAGTLSITAPAAMTLNLGTPVLASNGQTFTATGAATPVTVTDTRAGDFGWTLKVQSTDFIGTHGGTSFVPPTKFPWQKNSINAYDLGFTATTLTAPTGETVNTGVSVSTPSGPTPGNGLLPTYLLPGVAGTSGLGAARQIGFGQGGIGLGSATGDAVFAGTLQLNVPTVTIQDTYTATLTYTLTSN